MKSPEEVFASNDLGILSQAVEDHSRLILDNLGREVSGGDGLRGAVWDCRQLGKKIVLVCSTSELFTTSYLRVTDLNPNNPDYESYHFSSICNDVEAAGGNTELLGEVPFIEGRRESFGWIYNYLLTAPVAMQHELTKLIEYADDNPYADIVTTVVSQDKSVEMLARLLPICEADVAKFDDYAWEEVEARVMAKYGISQNLLNHALQRCDERLYAAEQIDPSQ